MGSHITKLYSHFTWNLKLEIDLPNYETKSDVKRAARVDISSFAKKVDLGS